MSELRITRALERIIKSMTALKMATPATFRDGVSRADYDRAISALPFTPPDAVRELYMFCDGMEWAPGFDELIPAAKR